jgi:Rod binding domain-containing protein
MKEPTAPEQLFSAPFAHQSTLNPVAASQAQHEQNVKAATDFESLLLKQMINSMWAAVKSEKLLSGSNEEEMYRDMFSEQLAKELAEHQSLGIRDAVLGEMSGKKK